MLRKIRSYSGQAQIGEVVVLFGLVVAAIITMTTYVRRAYQGRIYDVDAVMMATADIALNNRIKVEYEPYYVDTGILRDQSLKTVETRPDGILTRDVADSTRTISISHQAPPARAADWK